MPAPNTPNPADTVRLSTSKPSEEVYAVVRDSLGNWAATSRVTTWAPAINTIATVASSKPDLGEGTITKGSVNCTVIVSGTDTNLGLSDPSDSTVVVVMSYWYGSLQIVAHNSISYPIDSLTMNTNKDSILYVFGHRDDGMTPVWEEVSAKWELVDKSLEYIIAAPPASAHKYTLSPVDTATGRILVTFGEDSVTVPDTALVRFIPGGPMRVEFELLTPDSLSIAGDTLTTVVRLYNGDTVDIYIDSLVQACDTAGPDSVFMAYFAEYNSGDVPQTDWLPYVTITGIPDIAAVSGQLCADGAPAVVWKVLKTASSSGDPSKDRVSIALSESIVNTDGSSFMYAGISPAAIFNVWHKTASGFEY